MRRLLSRLARLVFGEWTTRRMAEAAFKAAAEQDAPEDKDTLWGDRMFAWSRGGYLCDCIMDGSAQAELEERTRQNVAWSIWRLPPTMPGNSDELPNSTHTG